MVEEPPATSRVAVSQVLHSRSPRCATGSCKSPTGDAGRLVEAGASARRTRRSCRPCRRRRSPAPRRIADQRPTRSGGSEDAVRPRRALCSPVTRQTPSRMWPWLERGGLVVAFAPSHDRKRTSSLTVALRHRRQAPSFACGDPDRRVYALTVSTRSRVALAARCARSDGTKLSRDQILSSAAHFSAGPGSAKRAGYAGRPANAGFRAVQLRIARRSDPEECAAEQ